MTLCQICSVNPPNYLHYVDEHKILMRHWCTLIINTGVGDVSWFRKTKTSYVKIDFHFLPKMSKPKVTL